MGSMRSTAEMDGEQRGSRNREGEDEEIIIYKHQLAKVLQDKIYSLFFSADIFKPFRVRKNFPPEERGNKNYSASMPLNSITPYHLRRLLSLMKRVLD